MANKKNGKKSATEKEAAASSRKEEPVTKDTQKSEKTSTAQMPVFSR